MYMINILGVKINQLKRVEVLESINGFLNRPKQCYIVTPNPEIVLAAQQDEELFYILNKADISIPDGAGLKFAAVLKGKHIRRVTGADLLKNVLKLAQERKKNVLIFNYDKGLSKRGEIFDVLKKKYPKLNFLILDVDRMNPVINWKEVNKFKADIMFCTFGSPFQEKFIFHNLKNVKSVKVAIGVGGAFDFLTRKAIRSPKFLRRIGMEWFWRLLTKPARIVRIYNAVAVFTYKILVNRFIHPFQYRPNVSCLVFKREEDSQFKVLVVERRDGRGIWQLPQGGTDGESLEKAGKREMLEELGVDKIETIKTFKNLHKYKFGKRIGGHKGQKQGLFIGEFKDNEDKIKINFWDHKDWKWVDIDHLIDIIEDVRKEATSIFLEKFIETVERDD